MTTARAFELSEQDVLAHVQQRRRRLSRGPVRAESLLAGAGILFFGVAVGWNLLRFI